MRRVHAMELGPKFRRRREEHGYAEATDNEFDALASRLTDPSMPHAAADTATGAAAARRGRSYAKQYGSESALEKRCVDQAGRESAPRRKATSPTVRARISEAEFDAFTRLGEESGRSQSELVQAIHLLLFDTSWSASNAPMENRPGVCSGWTIIDYRNTRRQGAGRRLCRPHALRLSRPTVAPGVIGVVGVNGAGKSTLLKLLGDVEQPLRARYRWRRPTRSSAGCRNRSRLARLAIEAMDAWVSIPFIMIRGGLQAMPREVMEAATVDGASPGSASGR